MTSMHFSYRMIPPLNLSRIMPIFLMSILADICEGTKIGWLDLLLEY